MTNPDNWGRAPARNSKFIALPLHRVPCPQRLARKLLTFNYIASANPFVELVSSAGVEIIVPRNPRQRKFSLCRWANEFAEEQMGAKPRLQFLLGGAS